MKPKEHKVVYFKPPDLSVHKNVHKNFCWGCAASRDLMIAACGEPFASCMAEDGKDVFALVAQIVYEDCIADQPGYESLACHKSSLSGKYRLEIDGRLRAVEEKLNASTKVQES